MLVYIGCYLDSSESFTWARFLIIYQKKKKWHNRRCGLGVDLCLLEKLRNPNYRALFAYSVTGVAVTGSWRRVVLTIIKSSCRFYSTHFETKSPIYKPEGGSISTQTIAETKVRHRYDCPSSPQYALQQTDVDPKGEVGKITLRRSNDLYVRRRRLERVPQSVGSYTSDESWMT